MAALRSNDIRESFELWFDEAGKDRNVEHNLPRVKARANGAEIEVIFEEGQPVHIKSTTGRDAQNIKAFKHGRQAVAFVSKFQKPMRMHWNHEITTTELFMIIQLVVKKNMNLDDAMDSAINYDD
jgi:hypothetical protein